VPGDTRPDRQGLAGRAMTGGITPDMLDGGLAEDLAAASLAMARRFAPGATLWCVAPSWEPHAHHMAVEFVHPVIMGKRALPAFALTGSDLVGRAGVAVRTGDILIAVAGGQDADVADLMRRAPAWGAASAWIGSGPRPPAGAADHVLWIDDPDPMAPATGRFVLLYHLLWELTHVCFEHPGLLTEPAEGAGQPPPAGKREPEATAFLYPFLEADERDAGPLLADLSTSARAKTAESAALQQATLAAGADQVAACGAAMAERFAAGGRLYAFGNGGSSTDCATFATLFASPPTGAPASSPTSAPAGAPPACRALPALNLAADQAVVTALGNDVGFDLVFSRQIIAHAAARDIAVAFSTSGNSRDLMAALREAHGRGLLTVGLAGYDGGEMAASGDVDYCFVVRSQSIHRIQESQALLGYHLWASAQQSLRKSAPNPRGATR
jgi:D-sedoheptulose 7-phosphate isomerase